MEPPKKGHFGANSFDPCREVVPISEGPLSEVPLYTVVDSHGVGEKDSVAAERKRRRRRKYKGIYNAVKPR